MFSGTAWLLNRKRDNDLVLPTARVPKARELTEVLAAATPFPDRFRSCGLLLAESVIPIVPERMPSAAGVNVTVKVQEPPGEIGVAQLSVSEKSPLAVMVVMPSATVWLFISSTFLLEDGVPITAFGMNTLEGAKLTGGGVPVAGLRRTKLATEGTPEVFSTNIM